VTRALTSAPPHVVATINLIQKGFEELKANVPTNGRAK